MVEVDVAEEGKVALARVIAEGVIVGRLVVNANPAATRRHLGRRHSMRQLVGIKARRPI